MGDLRLPQFDDNYDRNKMGAMVDTLENTFANISRVFAFVKKGAYQLFSNIIPGGSQGVIPTALMFYEMPGNTLAKDGYNIKIEAWGTFAANANNKQLDLYFGAALLYSTGVVAVNDGVWKFESTVTRTGFATQQAITTVFSNNATVIDTVTYVVPTELLSGIIEIRCVGTGINDDDIIEKGLLINIFPQE